MDDNDVDSSESLQRLQELRQMNSERWIKLRKLHQDYLDVVEERRQQQQRVQQERGSLLLSPAALLECELQQLQAIPPPTRLPTLNSRDFAMELVESYRQVADTQTVMEHRIELEKNTLRQFQIRHKQQEQLETALQALQSDQQAQTITNEDNVDGTTLTSIEENQWLKTELNYVAERIEASGQQVSQNAKRLPSQNPSREHDGQDNDSSNERTKQGQWSLDKLVLELINQFLASPTEPYMFLGHPTPPVDPRHVELLQTCWVIQRHDDNPNLFRLRDYSENSESESS